MTIKVQAVWEPSLFPKEFWWLKVEYGDRTVSAILYADDFDNDLAKATKWEHLVSLVRINWGKNYQVLKPRNGHKVGK